MNFVLVLTKGRADKIAHNNVQVEYTYNVHVEEYIVPLNSEYRYQFIASITFVL